jgi:hypothetical protein
MVLSDNTPTRDIFGTAAVMTGSDPEEIAAALRTAISEREQLEAGARALQGTFSIRWQTQADAAWRAIESRAGSGKRATA